MRKHFILVSLCALFLTFPGVMQQAVPRKKIVVFYSGGGGGHVSGCEAIKANFKDTYNVIGVNLLKEVLYPLDPIRKITFHLSDAEKFYNSLIAGDWHRLTNTIVQFGKKVGHTKREKIDALLTEFLSREKPDLIMSVMPMFNGSLKRVAAQMHIPFVIVSVDLDTSNYILHLQPPYSRQFCYCLVHDDKEVLHKISSAQMNNEHVATIGFPLRLDFFEKKDKQSIAKKFGFPEQTPRIMIMMGAIGSTHVLRYVKQLQHLKESAHLVVCIGRNESLRRRLQRIKLPPHLSMSIIGFTNHISDIMAVCDVIITKPGPTSIFESIESQLPLILDCVSTTLDWERLNIDFVLKYQLGKKVNSFDQVCSVVTEMLHKGCQENIRKQMTYFSSRNYSVKLRSLLHSLLSERGTGLESMLKEIPFYIQIINKYLLGLT